MARSEKILRWLLLGGVIIAIWLLAGCSKPEPVVRVVEVPSSRPYQFIRWSREDTPETVAAVKRHNRTHQAVKDAEKKAKAQ
jgi:hypothetical protein